MKRDALVKRVQLDLDVIARRLPTALDRIVQERAGVRGTRYDPDQTSREARWELDPQTGERVSIVSPSDPTGDAAVARASGDLRNDPSLAALRQLDVTLRQLEGASRTARSIVTTWSTTDPSLDDDPGCEIVGSATGVFEPTHRRGFDHDGNLPARFRVGRWSYDFIRRHDRLPTPTEVRKHVDGQRVRGRKAQP